MIRWFSRTSAISLIALIFLCVTWELWLAPVRPGGSMLFLKALPLLLPLFGILREKRYTFQWTSMLSLAYLTEGLVRVATDTGTSRLLAAAETTFAALLFIGCLGFAYYTAPSRTIKAEG
jgi:uncharacterized membrane protein